MLKNNKLINVDNILVILILIVLPIFNGKLSDTVIVLLAIGLIIVQIVYNGKLNIYKNKEEKKIVKSSILYLIALISIFILKFREIGDAIRIIQFLICLITLVYFKCLKNPHMQIKLLKLIASLLIIVSFLLYVIQKGPKVFYGFYNHFNTLGTIIMLCMMLIAIPIDYKLKKKYIFLKLIIMILGFFVLIVSTNRSALLTVLIFYVILLARKIFKNSKIFYRIVFICMTIFILWFIIIYPNLYGTSLGNQLEQMSRIYFNKNFYSGRQIIWKEIINAMEGKEILGYGLSMIPEKIYKTSFSSHNLYLQTYLQGGILNVAALVIFIISIFSAFISEKNIKYKAFNIAFLLGLIFHECFEVTLLQNQMNIAIIYWMIIGLIINLGNKEIGVNENKV